MAAFIFHLLAVVFLHYLSLQLVDGSVKPFPTLAWKTWLNNVMDLGRDPFSINLSSYDCILSSRLILYMLYMPV